MARNTKTNELLSLAAVALAATAAMAPADSQAAPKKGAKSVECFGINSCKGTNGCAVDKQQIDLASKTFGARFAKAQTVACAGNIDGSAKNGFLGWTKKDNQEDCLKAGGFVFEKDKNGDLKIVKKDG
jgi:hypothetical protein